MLTLLKQNMLVFYINAMARPDADGQGPRSSCTKSWATNRDLNSSFSPMPDYTGLALATGHGDVSAFRAFTAR